VISADQVSGQVFDHLGLVAATIDKLKLVEKVDQRLPLSNNKGVKVTMGQRFAAMILNGLGFIDDRLYMFPEFLANKPVHRLFGPDVLAEHFNDDALGRCLDAIDDYGETKFFSEVAFEIGTAFGLLGKTARFDTTSLVVYGEYAEQEVDESERVLTEKEDPPEPFHITHGYSKEGRPDLKQVVLTLATTGGANLPIWMVPQSGNASDKVVLQQAAERMKKFSKALKEAPSFLFVGDSAMYEACVKQAGDMLWLSRVPHSHNKAKEVLRTLKDDKSWVVLNERYQIWHEELEHKEVKQRWLLVHSKAAYERDLATLKKRIEQEKKAQDKALWHSEHQVFGCEQDARKKLGDLEKKLKFHQLAEVHFVPKEEHAGKGRPKKEARPEVVGFTVRAKLVCDDKRIAEHSAAKGRFILATNQLDKQALTDAEMLHEYKEQTHTESGFRFIKGNAFEVSSVFLKKKERVQALMVVMTLCLMVYNLAQYFLRQSLKENQDTIPDPLKKPTQKPTMARVCRMFHGVQVIHIRFGEEVKEFVANLNDVLRKVIVHFGKTAEQMYGLRET